MATALQVEQVRITETAPDNFAIEVANAQPEPITLSNLCKDIGGYPLLVDLTRAPHILIAGSNATEKNALLHTLLLSLVYKLPPTGLRLILVDNKSQEFAQYADLPHLLYPLICRASAKYFKMVRARDGAAVSVDGESQRAQY